MSEDLFSNFQSLDMRVGTVLSAEDFPEARKPAYKLRIDFGDLGVLQSSAQVTEVYRADELPGKQVVAVVNFEPKRIAGFKSECLVLGVDDAEGNVVLLQPERPLPNGNRVY
ncbi:MAG: tRNA-binding protein [Spirochaetota bacterium]